MAALLLVAATVLLWPRDRPAAPPTSVPAPQATRPPTDPAALQKQLDGVVEAGAPGVVGLVHTGHRTWQGASGLGDLRAKRPARAGDRFRIGSVTKSFVATVVLQLIGEGHQVWGHGGSLPGYNTAAFSIPGADGQLVLMTNLEPEPEPAAARAAVENLIRRELSC
jgi:Beta-lactamase